MRRALAVCCAVVAVAFIGAGAGASAPVATCEPTVSDGAGPFGRGAPPRRAKVGTGHVLTGTVLSVNCRPIAGARVYLWQSNKRGEYTRAGSATVVTDRAGHFRFEGPRPSSYEGRPPHIHLRILARDHETLETRYVSRPAAKRGSITVVLAPIRL